MCAFPLIPGTPDSRQAHHLGDENGWLLDNRGLSGGNTREALSVARGGAPACNGLQLRKGRPPARFRLCPAACLQVCILHPALLDPHVYGGPELRVEKPRVSFSGACGFDLPAACAIPKHSSPFPPSAFNPASLSKDDIHLHLQT